MFWFYLGAVFLLFLVRILFFSRGSPQDVKGKVVIITGGGMGLGKELACRLAALGARVAIWDIRKDLADQTAAAIRAGGRECRAFHCDVGDKDMVQKVAEETVEVMGGVDILINNAGIVFGKRFLELKAEEVERTMRVNFFGPVHTMKSLLPMMVGSARGGHIVNVASCMGMVGAVGMSDYCASKSAIIGLHESIRLELSALGASQVSTTLVLPYAITTGMFKGIQLPFSFILPMLKEEDVAANIVQAVLHKDKLLIMPYLLHWLPRLLRLLPVSLQDFVIGFMGGKDGMKNFVGRGNQWG